MKPFSVHLWRGCRRIALDLAVLAGLVTVLGAAPRHLFLDPSFIEHRDGVGLAVNPPIREEVVIRPDRPWEQLFISFYTTVRDEDGKLRMWYICRDKENQPNVAYAESIDGVNWVKPDLGVVDYKGSPDNNLVGIRALEGAVYRDPKGRESERYIYVTSVSRGGGVFRFTSSDGLRWKRDAEPLLPFECDSQNVVFWDERKGKYALYLRGWGPRDPNGGRRKVVYVEADDLTRPLGLKPLELSHHENGDVTRQPWIDSEATTVLKIDAKDGPNIDVYTNAIQPYPVDPRWYVGFPAFYRLFRDSPYRNDGRTEVQFIGSSDGLNWHRYGREVYAGPGLVGPQSGNMVYMGVGLVVRGDEIWQYGTRYRTTHGDDPGRREQVDGAIYRFVQRVDGFVSLDTGGEAGVARTKPVLVSGRKMLLNVDTAALGSIRVGLMDESGKPVPGFTVEDSHPLEVNSTGAVVSWKGGSDLTDLQGKKVSVEFRSARTKLYSFRFE